MMRVMRLRREGTKERLKLNGRINPQRTKDDEKTIQSCNTSAASPARRAVGAGMERSAATAPLDGVGEFCCSAVDVDLLPTLFVRVSGVIFDEGVDKPSSACVLFSDAASLWGVLKCAV